MSSDYKNATGYIQFIIDRNTTAPKYYGGMNTFNYKRYDKGHINPDYYLYLLRNKDQLGIPKNIDYVRDNL